MPPGRSLCAVAAAAPLMGPFSVRTAYDRSVPCTHVVAYGPAYRTMHFIRLASNALPIVPASALQRVAICWGPLAHQLGPAHAGIHARAQAFSEGHGKVQGPRTAQAPFAHHGRGALRAMHHAQHLAKLLVFCESLTNVCTPLAVLGCRHVNARRL